MIKKYYPLILSIAFLALAVSFFVWRVQGIKATAVGTAQAGDECNTHAEDESHICAPGLVCVPQNENSEGNGKCGYLNTPTANPTQEPTATPSGTPSATAEPTLEPSQTPTSTPVVQSTDQPKGGSGVSDGLGCGSHDCSVHPTPPATVLAATGTFKENMFLGVTSFGAVMTVVGIFMLAL